MEKRSWNVEGMSCEHCVKAVTTAVGALDGVSKVEVSLAEKTVMVDYDPAQISLSQITAEIEEQGYEVIE